MSSLPVKADRLREFGVAIGQRLNMYKEVLPPRANAKRLLRSVLMAMQQNPDLVECTPDSIFASVMRAAMLGLEVGGTYGGAWLVPFRNKSNKKEAQLIPDYRGLEKLARQSGEVASIRAVCVYNGEAFAVVGGTNPSIEHTIDPTVSRTDDDIVAVYAVAHFTAVGAPPQFEVLSREQIAKVRNSSRGKNALMWTQWWGEGAKKTAVRRLCKHLPQSPQMMAAMAIEDAAESDKPAVIPVADDWSLPPELPPPDDAAPDTEETPE